MINERERRMLQELERRMSADDPALAQRLAGKDQWARWRRAWRIGTNVPVALLVMALSVAALSLQLSALGLPLLLWALIGVARRLVVARRKGMAPLPGPLGRT